MPPVLSSQNITLFLLKASAVLMIIFLVAAIGWASLKTNYLFPGLNATSMIEGSTLKPFAFRMLIPALAKTTTEVLPDTWEESLSRFLIRHQEFLKRHDFWERHLVFPYYVQGVYVFGFMLLFLGLYPVALYLLGQSLYPKTPLLWWAMPVIGLLCVLPFQYPRSYYYDFSTLTLWAFSLLALHRRVRFTLFAMLFFITCSNKETGVFLMIPYLLYMSQFLPKKTLFIHSAILLSIYAAIRATTFHIFQLNGGVDIEYQFIGQWQNHWTSPFPFERMPAVFCICFLLAFQWTKKPLLARQTLWIFVPLFVAYQYGGCCQEYRVFYELFPAATALIAHTLLVGTDIHKSELFQKRAPRKLYKKSTR